MKKGKADVEKWFADGIGTLREAGLRKPGDLLEHLGGPTGVMETLKNEPALRTKILDGAVKDSIVPRLQLAPAANALEIALATEDIAPGRVEDVLTPAEQARICSAEENWIYLWLGKWRDKQKRDDVVKALAAMLRSAVTHGLATAEDIYGAFRGSLGELLPRQELGKLILKGKTDILTDRVLYDTLDLEAVVDCLKRSDVLALIDLVAETNGIVKLAPKEEEKPAVVPTTDELGAVAESDSIPADDMVPVGDDLPDWRADESPASASPADDGDPEITSEPVPAGDQEVEKALEALDLESSPPPEPATRERFPAG